MKFYKIFGRENDDDVFKTLISAKPTEEYSSWNPYCTTYKPNPQEWFGSQKTNKSKKLNVTQVRFCVFEVERSTHTITFSEIFKQNK